MNPSCDTTVRKPRQSNIELLRIVAMFLVLIVHSDFWALDPPVKEDFAVAPLSAWTKSFFEFIGIVCVNTFVLISGWFGIKPTVKGFLNFIFQCLFFLLGIYFTVHILHGTTAEISPNGVWRYLSEHHGNWFVTAYACLYILSPLLNLYLKKTTRRQQKIVLIIFFAFQTIFGWITRSAHFIQSGYTAFSLVGLYLLGRYTNSHMPKLRGKTSICLGIYAITVILDTLGFYAVRQYGSNLHMYAYVNPLVIIGALSLVLAFDSMKIGYCKTINFIAKSSFAVYLLHTGWQASDIFIQSIRDIFARFDGILCVAMIFIFITAVFATAVILDQPRKWIWNGMVRLCGRVREKFDKHQIQL